MRNKNLLSISDLTAEELEEIWNLAAEIKNKRKSGVSYKPLAGKSLAMIFQKPSTRTRLSFEVGMFQLGGQAIFLTTQEIQLGRGETVSDTARILSGYVDGVLIRTFSQAEVEELAANAAIPIINGLTDLLHPCQIIADLFTIREVKGTLRGLKVAYVGDGNNIVHSWLYGAAKTGVDLTVCTPAGYEPKNDIVRKAREAAGNTCRIVLDNNPRRAVTGADILYTDVWTSMGQEAEAVKRRTAFADYRIDSALMKHAKKDALLMHCLPAHRGEEVSSEVIDGPRSIIFEQAQNRLPVQQAVLVLLLTQPAC